MLRSRSDIRIIRRFTGHFSRHTACRRRRSKRARRFQILLSVLLGRHLIIALEGPGKVDRVGIAKAFADGINLLLRHGQQLRRALHAQLHHIIGKVLPGLLLEITADVGRAQEHLRGHLFKAGRIQVFFCIRKNLSNQPVLMIRRSLLSFVIKRLFELSEYLDQLVIAGRLEDVLVCAQRNGLLRIRKLAVRALPHRAASDG